MKNNDTLIIDNRIVGEIYNMSYLNGGLNSNFLNGIIFSTADECIISEIIELANKKSYLPKCKYSANMVFINDNYQMFTFNGCQVLEYSYGEIGNLSDMNFTVKILIDNFRIYDEITPIQRMIIRNSKINKLLK